MEEFKMIKKIIIGLMLISIIFISGCNNKENIDEDEITFCPEFYSPVCGIDGVTYSNDCFAEISGVEIAYEGECGEENAFAQDRICTREYNPVCGMDDVTYGNPCMAGKMTIRHEGECEPNIGVPNPASVNCIELGGETRIEEDEFGEYGICVLPSGEECEEWALYRGECDTKPLKVYCTEEQKQAEICTMEYAPVCGSDNMTYGNKCVACSHGIEYYVRGEC
jgi:ovoinhibitor